eukprot:106881_1
MHGRRETLSAVERIKEISSRYLGEERPFDWNYFDCVRHIYTTAQIELRETRFMLIPEEYDGVKWYHDSCNTLSCKTYTVKSASKGYKDKHRIKNISNDKCAFMQSIKPYSGPSYELLWEFNCGPNAESKKEFIEWKQGQVLRRFR